MVVKSWVKDAWRRLRVPVETMALPKRWHQSFRISRLRVDRLGVRGVAYGGSRRPDTVKHVGSEGDGDEEIFGVADAHYVAGFIRREPVCAGIHTAFSTLSSFRTWCLELDVHFTVRNLVLSTG